VRIAHSPLAYVNVNYHRMAADPVKAALRGLADARAERPILLVCTQSRTLARGVR